ncbi:MAG: hypothetical protein M5R36_29945 [Deltaproteobacteria bacterium]|nr:hypothetical protein [Deltaproteobacteria bacterium]
MAGPIERPAAFLRTNKHPDSTDRGRRARRPDPHRVRDFQKLILAVLIYQITAPYLLLAGVPDARAALALWKPWQLWMCVTAYYFYLYLDFAGYSDVAIGLSRMFGYRIMENFRWPLLATNVADFWRRWHISLTGWITDYVYIGLGGNRRGLRLAARNTMIAMILVGLWHGLSPHFVLWGAYHGVFNRLPSLPKNDSQTRRRAGVVEIRPRLVRHVSDRQPRLGAFHLRMENVPRRLR